MFQNYQSDIAQENRYYPFGMLMDMGDSLGYRFGFGGHELDNNVKGNGNHLSFGNYGYDPRLGRRWRPDPFNSEMASWSPYTYCFNNPVTLLDEDGKWPKWSGVTFLYFEADAGAGFAYGVNYIRQSGVARDQVGKKHFIMQSKYKVKPDEDGSFFLGIGASISGALRQSWKSKTFTGLLRYHGMTFTIDAAKGGGYTWGFGDSEFTIGLSFGLDFTIQRNATEVVESISLTYDEAKDVNKKSTTGHHTWGVDKVEQNLDDSYSGFVSIDVRPNKVVTDIKVFSEDGDGKVWTSENYKTEAKKAEKK